jgi:hypothetical protein
MHVTVVSKNYVISIFIFSKEFTQRRNETFLESLVENT